MPCPFCQLIPSDILFATPLVIGLHDKFPVSPGHTLLITKRHIPSWFDASPEEQLALTQAIEQAKSLIQESFEPDGFNIGINVGEAAGQTVPHLHVHVIPRYSGDVADPRGGVRYVIREAGNYLSDSGKVSDGIVSAEEFRSSSQVFGSVERPLFDALVEDLAAGESCDLAVAFITEAGLLQIAEYVVDFLERGGKLRVLTGDYLDVTEPRALRRLLDWREEYPDGLEARVFETEVGVSFHPKAYLFGRRDGVAVSYIGSSNLTRQALRAGVEWNQRMTCALHDPLRQLLKDEFEQLFGYEKVVTLSPQWISDYAERRVAQKTKPPQSGVAIDNEIRPEPPAPNSVQREALDCLEETRSIGNRAGLVVMATGLGKTWLAAFDSDAFKRVLFIAHREEILNQALETFRKIRPEASLGKYLGGQYDRNVDVLFASVQTLSRANHLQKFERQDFDYVVVDEFHHAAAATYRRLIDYFEPDFLLGLTATPERSDGGDLLGLCGENLVYRCDVADGINCEILSPFQYYGVPDEVDFTNIPWRSGRFDPAALEHAVTTGRRAQNALDQWKKRGQKKTLAFCVSKRHADFMSDFFQSHGVESVAVHSGSNSAPRTQSLRQLERGEIQVLFAVDMFNEGVDVPSIDTVLMLRPTESKILWLQQFGRGLRKAADKSHLTVIDYIGNHRSFLQVPMMLLPGAGSKPGEVTIALEALVAGELQLPAGCSVEYEVEALNILKALSRPTAVADQIIDWYRRFEEQYGRRPFANEAWHEGYDPRKLKTSYGSWHSFVNVMGGLSGDQGRAFESSRDFLTMLEKTPMTKSFKMVTLLSMIAQDAFPGRIELGALASGARRIANRSSLLHDELVSQGSGDGSFYSLLENNPIKAWTGARGTEGKTYFQYDNQVLETTDLLPQSNRYLAELAQEICDWRLSEYLERRHGETQFAKRIVCKVSHSGGRPILFLPDRDKNPGIPNGWTPVLVDENQVLANFVKVAVNTVASHQDGSNQLPEVLRSWFGANTGLPGSRDSVQFIYERGGYRLEPVGQNRDQKDPVLYKEYMRDEIPPIWDMEFNEGKWNQGFVSGDRKLFLLVTLEKKGMVQEHQYEDHFLSSRKFRWLSQRRTRQATPSAQKIVQHKQKGIDVHLFVRRTKTTPDGKAAPFTYCGKLDFLRWTGDAPITVWWELQSPLTTELSRQFDAHDDEEGGLSSLD